MPHRKSPLGTPVSAKALSALRSRASRKFRGFTLVELIVVITILAILATVGFLALSGYTSDANKSAVVGNLRTVEKGLSANATVTGKFPSPSGAVTVTYSGGVAWYQGTAGKSVMAAIGMGEPPKDPNGNSEFDYSLSANGMEYQVASAYLSAVSAEPFAMEASAAVTDGTNVRTPTAAVSGNYNGLFVPVSTGGTNYLIAAPSIVLSNATASNRELKSMSPSFVVDGKPGTPASWSGKVQGLSQTGMAFGWAAYASGKIFESQTEAFPKTSTGVSALSSALSSAYSGTSLTSVSKISTFLASPDKMDSAVSSAGANSLGRDMAPAYSTSSSSGGGSSGGENPPANSCASPAPSGGNYGTVTVGSPTSVGQAWTYSATPGNCTYACSGGYSGTDCATAPTPTDPNWDKVVLAMGMDATNGSSNAFKDEKGNSLLYQGTVTASTSDAKFGAAAYFDPASAVNNSIEIPGADTAFGTADFTIEMFVKFADSTESHFFGTHPMAEGAYIELLKTSTNNIRFYSSSAARITSTGTVTIGNWTHVALVRASGTTRLYVDGTLAGSFTDSINYGKGLAVIGQYDRGRYGSTQYRMKGSIDNVRITKGLARYAGNSFPVPTSAVPYKDFTAAATVSGDDSVGRKWSDGTYAKTCFQYAFPESGYQYSGSTGNGVYLIDPDGAGSIVPFKVYCNMTTDGGGWTMIMNVPYSTSRCSTISVISGFTGATVCGYLSEPNVKAIALSSSIAKLVGGAYSVKTTNANGIQALQSTTHWHNGTTWTGSWFDWSGGCPTSQSSWPNMYHAGCNSAGVHWLTGNAYVRVYNNLTEKSEAWIR